MKDICLAFITNILDTYDGMVQQILLILTCNCFSTSDGTVGGMYTLALNVKAVVMPISLIIMNIVFVIDFLKYSIKMDILNWQNGITIFFKFILAKVTMDLSAYLMDAIYTTAAEWITSIGSDKSATLGATAGALIKSEISGYGTMKCLGLMISSSIMFVIIVMCAIIMNVIAYARIFEIMIYVSISPLPCAFLPMEHSRIPFKFFLNFAGVCLQGVFMAISIKMYAVICTSILSGISNNSSVWTIIYNLVIGSIVCLMAIIKSGSWANKVFEGA